MKQREFADYPAALKALRYLEERWRTPPRVGIILGSGLGDVIHRVREARIIPYKSIPYFPQPTVQGHAGKLHCGIWGKIPVAILEGRAHLYEGYTPSQVVFPARVLALAGIQVLIATCAAGGIAGRATPGSLMVLSDHLNFQGANPFAGAKEERWGSGFVDLSRAYDPQLRRMALRAGVRLRLKCSEGVYAALLGPGYETPAEIRALRRLGADAVGMSTVPEVMAARQLSVRVLAIASITNRAAGLSPRRISHQNVLEVAKRGAHSLARLLDALLQKV